MSSFSILSLNCQGCCSQVKKNAILSVIQQFHPVVFCLQESNIDPIRHGYFNIPNYVSFFNPCTTLGSGTVIFVHNSWSEKSHNVLFAGKV